MIKEEIICSAIKVILPDETEKIFRGHRHNHCFQALNDELSYNYNRQQIDKFCKIQGFITSKNRFVERKEAMKIAINAQQGRYYGEMKIGRELLFSEDLY